MATWLWPGPRFCTVNPGTFAATSSIVSAPRSRSSDSVGAVTEIGTSSTVSSFLRAVTVISSVTFGFFSFSAVFFFSSGCGGGGVVWARRGVNVERKRATARSFRIIFLLLANGTIAEIILCEVTPSIKENKLSGTLERIERRYLRRVAGVDDRDFPLPDHRCVVAVR